MINSRTVEKRDLARVYISMPNHPREYLVRPVLARSDCGSMILLQRLDMYRYQTCFFRDVNAKDVRYARFCPKTSTLPCTLRLSFESLPFATLNAD